MTVLFQNLKQKPHNEQSYYCKNYRGNNEHTPRTAAAWRQPSVDTATHDAVTYSRQYP